MRRLFTELAIIVSAFVASAGASGGTFGDWASGQGYNPGDVMPSQVSATTALIDSLSGIGAYDWTTTPATELFLNDNRLSAIESGDFSGLTNLTDLVLQLNRISSIEPGDFSGPTNLSSLNLSLNRIPSLESGDFSGLASLTSLRLNGNNLMSIESGAFNGLANLTSLLLHDNDYSIIESGTLKGITNLTRLWLQNNPVLTDLNLDETEFSSLTSFTLADSVNITRVSLKNTVVNQSSLVTLLQGGNTNLIGIGELGGITAMDVSGVNFGSFSDLGPLYAMDDLTDLWLVNPVNLDANELDLWLNNLDTIEGTDSEGILYMTQADFDGFNLAGAGLLATWDSEPGHHVEIVVLGDFDLDGDADGSDFLAWQRGESPDPLSQSDLGAWEDDYGTAQAPALLGDFDVNGTVDGHDFFKWQLDPSIGSLAVWEANYGMGAPLSATSVAVPEPTTCTLALAALCLAMSWRRGGGGEFWDGRGGRQWRQFG